MASFIVRTGLTRRLVEANSPEDAILEYLYDKPTRSVFSVGEGDIDVRVATAGEIAELTEKKVRGHKPGPGQLAFSFDDESQESGRTEHAA